MKTKVKLSHKHFTIWARDHRPDYEPFLVGDPFHPRALYMWRWEGSDRVIIGTLYKDGGISFGSKFYEPR